MVRLSVNINKIATLRNARGGNMPNVLQVAKDCESFGAQGITVHPRPDERHIKYKDVLDLKPLVSTEFNVEGYPSPDFLDLVFKVKPHQVTLVPDPPEALTSNAGWDVVKYRDFLKETVARLQNEGIRVSIFMEPDASLMESAAETGTDRIELYTESYAKHFPEIGAEAAKAFADASKAAHACGLGVNAGHDLNLDNLKTFVQEVPHVLEVSIGHALICDSLYYGLQNTIGMYLALCNPPTELP